MIKKWQESFPPAEWILSDMRYFQLEKRFDAIIAWDSFFHLTPPAQRSMFKVFRKYLKQKGCLLFNSGDKYGEVYGEMEGYQFYHSSLDTKEYKALLEKYGFQVVLNKNADPACGRRCIWIARKIN